MSWPAERNEAPASSSSTASFPPLRATLELPAFPTPELVDALRHDRQVLVREAMLWQRWIRYLALAALTTLALGVGSLPREVMLLPVALTGLGYIVFVAACAHFIRRSEVVHEVRLPALLVTADMIALTIIVYSSGTVAEMGRILIGAALVVQLTVFYFGRALGTYAALLAVIAYMWATRLAPMLVLGPRPVASHIVYTLGVFLMVSAVLIKTYGSSRTRMNQLRLFCKLVEEGDLTPSFDLGTDKRPDDLTLLARSFEAMRARLAEQIGTDPLTGCLNRRALETRLRAEWRQAKRRSSTVAVLAIDLDHFKQINDTRGHPFGDIVLQEVAGIMKATARDTDAVARLGGDEFVIVLPDTGWQGALTFAERLRRKVDDFSFGAASGAMSLTVSVGVALARGNDPISPEMLLQEADRSLYKAKSGGRNRIFA